MDEDGEWITTRMSGSGSRPIRERLANQKREPGLLLRPQSHFEFLRSGIHRRVRAHFLTIIRDSPARQCARSSSIRADSRSKRPQREKSGWWAVSIFRRAMNFARITNVRPMSARSRTGARGRGKARREPVQCCQYNHRQQCERWRFWEGRLPGQSNWRRLDFLRTRVA